MGGGAGGGSGSPDDQTVEKSPQGTMKVFVASHLDVACAHSYWEIH